MAGEAGKGFVEDGLVWGRRGVAVVKGASWGCGVRAIRLRAWMRGWEDAVQDSRYDF